MSGWKGGSGGWQGATLRKAAASSDAQRQRALQPEANAATAAGQTARLDTIKVVLWALLIGALAVALALAMLVPMARDVPVSGGIIVRCRRGHLFTTMWVPAASFKAVRLGQARFQHCPVGHHWSLVVPVNEASLSPEEIATARAVHDARIV